ncbi:MAG: CapA family protein, partial [Spirochaetes bacterium]|nr:CapA family protein [Spirochaetota bacterium]
MFKKSLFKKIKQLKSKYLIFHTIIFVSIILFSSLIDGINKSIIIEKYYFDNMKIISLINLNLKINGLRNITAEKTWYDSFFLKFYKRLYLYETPVISKGRIDIANIICKKTYYCTVNIDENLNRLNNNEIIELYNDYFIKNITDKVSFKEAERLGINERLLINNETGEPVVFYRYYSYKTTDGFNKELKNFKLKIQSDEKEKKAIVLGFAGDTAIEDFVKDAIKQYGTDFAFNEVKNIIDFPDIMSVNLECCVTERGEREEKHFTFRSSEDDFKIIASSSIDYVSTANNHIKDYGESGIIDTKEFLNKNNISHSGCGKN